MTGGMTILTLLIAAALEAGGDALMRLAMHREAGLGRYALGAIAAAVLTAYGYTVNAPAWDFGRLLGLYVVFFFVIAQLISWLVFQQPPSRTVLAGGVLILAGGAVIAFGN